MRTRGAGAPFGTTKMKSTRRVTVDVGAPGCCHTVAPGSAGRAARNASTKPCSRPSAAIQSVVSAALKSPITRAGRGPRRAPTTSTMRRTWQASWPVWVEKTSSGPRGVRTVARSSTRGS